MKTTTSGMTLPKTPPSLDLSSKNVHLKGPDLNDVVRSVTQLLFVCVKYKVEFSHQVGFPFVHPYPDTHFQIVNLSMKNL